MKSSKYHFQSSLVKSTSIIAVSLLFLIQCTDSKVEDIGFKDDIKEHFGNMNYKEIVFDNNTSLSKKVGVEYQRGDGILRDGKGKELSYKWAFLAGENGDLLTGYIGTSQMVTTAALELTRDETKDAIRRCSKKDGVQDMFACMDRVMARVESDCQASLSIEECKAACWLTPDVCRARPFP